METASHIPLLTNAEKTMAMMGQINKTNKLDGMELALLLRNVTLPLMKRAKSSGRNSIIFFRREEGISG